jgi:alpha-amylase
MTKYSNALLLLTLTILVGSTTQSVSEKKPGKKRPLFGKASVYFLMTDRFYNGDKSNDTNFNRTKTTENYVVLKEVILITKKIDEGYFDKLESMPFGLHQ